MTGRDTGAIRVEGLWKQLRRGQHTDSVRDVLASGLRRLTGRHDADPDEDWFWALRDLSFEVRPGEALGVIGPNGSGKSTLLKLLAGIMDPTRGEIAIEGRVGALIELAAGFHPELTGRENIFLQGGVMGLSRDEVRRRFDEIVEFAGIGDFLDTPVKRFSSGMSARLGFSIAAHLDPDVLLIDEVLSVGDLAFQRRALGRIQALVERQMPVILVSHQLERILSLCDRAILLSGGVVACQGTPAECVQAYTEGVHLPGHEAAAATDVPVRVEGLIQAPPEIVQPGQTVTLRLRGRVTRDDVDRGEIEGIAIGVWLRDVPGDRVLFGTQTNGFDLALPAAGTFQLEVELRVNAGPGLYRLQPYVVDRSRGQILQRAESALLEVQTNGRAFGSVHLDAAMRLEADP